MREPILADLHCHILPGIDDGAKDEEMTLALLRMEEADNVQGIVFTPHFHYERISVQEFVENRKKAYRQTAELCKREGIRIAARMGAEVYYTPALPFLNLRSLCFAGTHFILIEFPTTHQPSGIEDTLYAVMQQGYTPILAHVERYPYVTEDPQILYNWVSMGALAQINASGLIRGGHTAKLLERYIGWNLVHLLSTDAHHPSHRPAQLKAAYDKLPKDVAMYFKENGQSVFLGEEPDILEPRLPRYRLGRWI